MKNNFIFFLISTLVFSLVLLYCRYTEQVNYYEEMIASANSRISHLADLIEIKNVSWMSKWTSDTIWDNNGNYYLLSDKENCVVIVYSGADKEGCKACLSLEITDWRDAYENLKVKEFDIYFIACKTPNKDRLVQELNAMKITFPIIFDDKGKIFKELKLDWSPSVLFLKRGRVINYYTGDMNNRVITEQMIERYRLFLNNR